MGITFAKWRWIVPLRGMSRNTADNNLTDEFVAFVTEEAQGFSCLVTVLVQGLVAIIGNTRVWARIIFHWQEKSNFKNQKSKRQNVEKSAGQQGRDLQTHFGLRSLHLGVPVSLPWQEI